jgi:hypothetical protein
MNSISWIIYIAQIADALAYFVLALFALSLIMSFAYLTDPNDDDDDDDMSNTPPKPMAPEYLKELAEGRKKSNRAFAAAMVLLLIYILMPSRQTILYIAASESVEKAAMSDTTKELTKELRKYLTGSGKCDKDK